MVGGVHIRMIDKINPKAVFHTFNEYMEQVIDHYVRLYTDDENL